MNILDPEGILGTILLTPTVSSQFV